MSVDREYVGIGSFACAFGDLEHGPEDIADFDGLWEAQSNGQGFAAMGSAAFRKMTAPVEQYVVDALRRTLQGAETAAADVDHLVFATSDARLASLPPDFAVRTLDALGLVNCVPHLLSYQQCCSSLTALRYSRQLLADPGVTDVLLVALDFTPEDRDRVTSFALFSDAAAGCLLSRRRPGPFRLMSSAVHADPEGLAGRDSFASRQKVAQTVLSDVFDAAGRRLDEVAKVFPANLFQPVTQFNAMAAGIRPDRLHFADTLSRFGHCGNCDWMINLIDYQGSNSLSPGELYLAQSSAPGFYAAALLEAVAAADA
jgi:3-oxoacyl-[acyl-carrier-protein] synthase III